MLSYIWPPGFVEVYFRKENFAFFQRSKNRCKMYFNALMTKILVYNMEKGIGGVQNFNTAVYSLIPNLP